MKRSVAPIDSPKILADLRAKRANHEWLDRHRAELRIRFAGKFVAVHRGEVVASDPEFPRLLSRLRKRLADPSLAAVEFVSKEGVVWIL